MSIKISPSKILVYHDAGVATTSSEALFKQLQKNLNSSFQVEKIDSHYLKNNSWEKETRALFMGGGVCSQWDQNLGAKGIDKIRDFVHEGGLYFGFCAGAYFASASSYFKVSDQSPIEKKRLLGLFSGRAVGPIVPTSDVYSLESARAEKISFFFENSKIKGRFYYQGGCYFEVADNDQTEVIGWYKSQHPRKAAVIRSTFGKGMAWLSGIHPEYKWTEKMLCAESPKAFADLTKVLSEQEPFRRLLWLEITNRLYFSTYDYTDC